MSGGGGGGSKTTTTKQELPPELRQAYRSYSSKAERLFNQPYQSYGGQLVAGQTPDTARGYSYIRGAAGRGYDDTDASRGYFRSVAGGSQLGRDVQDIAPGINRYAGMDNPYLNRAIDQASRDATRHYMDVVNSGNDSTFARAGAFGGSAWRQAQADNERNLADRLGNIATSARLHDYDQQRQLEEANIARNLAADQFNVVNDERAYQTELARQQQAASALPGLASTQLNYGNALTGIGGQQQAQQQAVLDSAYQQWLRQQQDPYKKLDAYSALFGAAPRQTTQSTPREKVNPFTSALGGASTGAAVGGQYGGGTGAAYGAAAGAGLGLLGSLL